MCIPPNQAAAATALCPTGSSTPSGWDVWMVQLFGALGATISVVLLLIRRRPDLSPYVLVGYQALVKILLGAALSVVGLLALGAGLVSGIVYVGSQAALLLWAVLFGYSQQVGTRLLDNYADRLMDEVRPLPDRVLEPRNRR
jgi:ABC-type Fe3+-siderophore transport system permease subunit